MTSNDTNAAELLFAKWNGHIVPRSFNGGFVTLSYIVSLIGAASTLELINRRTAPKGKVNHLLLCTAAVTMGGISIWCMHYIGNRAIDIGNGDIELQIAYSAGFTALSFFMPIIVLIIAFVAIGTNEQVSWWRVGIGGTLAGAAICGMHYLGNASINNYVCIYNPGNVVGSALIAVAASIIALSVFFVFRASWSNSWWKRGMSAVLLAGAVSGMHWCASTGTQYRLIALAGTNQLSRNTTVIVVICLSVGACFIMAGFAMYTARIMQRYANKAQQVILAAAVFDKHGRVLVSTDGLLPSEKITDAFLEKTPQDSFSVAHPLFQWMFQASRNWSSITGIIVGITNHLTHLPHNERDSSRGGIKLITDHGELIENYDIIFRELFCAAAAGLAEKMKTSLADVGILWDEILATGGGGHVAHAQARRRQQTLDRSIDIDDFRKDSDGGAVMITGEDDLAEKGMFQQQNHIQEFGRGSLMFLVRRVENTRDVEALAAAGFRFAELHQVSGIIGSTMQVKTRSIEMKLRNMAAYAEENDMLEPGVHMALFGVRARVNNAYGFDVLARRNARNLLPAVHVPLARLDAWHVNFMRQFERMTPHHIARRIESLKHLSPKEAMFASQLRDSIEALRALIEDSIFDESVLVSKTVEMPCRPVSIGSSPGSCTVITFRIVIPIHLKIESPCCEFVPLNLFKVHQLVYKHSPNHLAFARSVHREIAPIINTVPVMTMPSKPANAMLSHSRRTSLRDARMASRLFRIGRPGTAGSNRPGAVDAEGNPIPTILRSRSSGAASGHTSSTLKLWNRRSRDSTDIGSTTLHSINSIDASHASSPPPAYATYQMDDLSPICSSQGQAATLASPLSTSQMMLAPQPSSFGGIMVSQEITVNVHSAGEMSDTSSGHNSDGGRRHKGLLRRRASDVPPAAAVIDVAASPTTMDVRNRPVPAVPHYPGGMAVSAGSPSRMNATNAGSGNNSSNSSSDSSSSDSNSNDLLGSGMEVRSMAADRSSVHIGSGVQVSNVEAEKTTDVPTFVDELFAFCVEGR